MDFSDLVTPVRGLAGHSVQEKPLQLQPSSLWAARA